MAALTWGAGDSPSLSRRLHWGCQGAALLWIGKGELVFGGPTLKEQCCGLVLTREAAGAAVVSGSFESVASFLSWGSWSCDAY